MNRFLLDTCTFIQWVVEPARISADARVAIGDGRSFVFVSAASTWEIAIKQKLGKLATFHDVGRLLRDNRFEELAISVAHSVETLQLPMHHKDPFDRLLVSQARLEDLQLITRDRQIFEYDVSTLAA